MLHIHGMCKQSKFNSNNVYNYLHRQHDINYRRRPRLSQRIKISLDSSLLQYGSFRTEFFDGMAVLK